MKFFTAITVLATMAVTQSAILPRQQNSQKFTGALAGIAATPVLSSGDAKRPFSVKGDTFVNVAAALQRSCDQQFNACMNVVNGGGAKAGNATGNAAITGAQCQSQKTQCDGASK